MRNWTYLMSDRARRARAAIVAAATVLLFAAMLVSFKQMPRQSYTQTMAGQAPSAAPEEDALDAFTAERASSRIAQMAALDSLINSGDELVSEDAARQKLELTGFMETETTLEGLLRARGWTDAVCTVHSDNCNVLVRAQELDDAQTASILALASAETGLGAANIKIITVD